MAISYPVNNPLPVTTARRVIHTQPGRDGTFEYDFIGDLDDQAREVARLEALGYTILRAGRANGIFAGCPGADVLPEKDGQ